MAVTALHSTLIGSELHYSKLQIIVGAPSSIPTYVGQTQYDQQNNILYIATGISSLADWKTQASTQNVVEVPTATYSAVSTDNGTTFVLTYNGARTFTLPTTPINGDYIVIQDSGSTGAYTNNITVSASSNIFSNGTSSYVISSDLASVCFVFDFNFSTWVINSTYIGLQPQVKRVRNTTGSNLYFDINDVNSLELSSTQSIIKKDLLVQDKTDLTKQLLIDLENATTGKTTVLNFVQTQNRVVTMFDATDRIIGTQTTDILTNKSFNNTTTILAANQLNFNNSGNTFHTSLKAGENAANLNMTLPIVAPIAGQVPYSIDSLGTLGWLTVQSASEQSVVTAANINALSSSTTTVNLTGSTTTNLNGITAGVGGQELTILNSSTAVITVFNLSGSASSGNKITLPLGHNLTILPGFSLEFKYDSNSSTWQCISQLAANNIIASTSGFYPSVGFLGEIKSNTGSLPLQSAGTYPITSLLNLPVGSWLFSFSVQFSISAASGFYGFQCGIGTVSASTSGFNDGYNSFSLSNGATAIPNSTLGDDFRSICPIQLQTFAPTSFYLNYSSTNSVTILGATITAFRTG